MSTTTSTTTTTTTTTTTRDRGDRYGPMEWAQREDVTWACYCNQDVFVVVVERSCCRTLVTTTFVIWVRCVITCRTPYDSSPPPSHSISSTSKVRCHTAKIIRISAHIWWRVSHISTRPWFRPRCSVGFVVPSIYGYERIRNHSR